MKDQKFKQVTNNLGSAMKHDFSKAPIADIPRSTFNRSSTHKTTFDAGYLIPIFVDEVLPGDTFNLDATFFARMATPIFPIMDNLFLDSFFFFVPTRLVWEHWEQFNGQQANPTDSTDYLIPQLHITSAGNPTGSLFDYMGIPPLVNQGAGTLIVSAIPFRCHNLIWNEWFRDQNLQDSLTVETDDGPDTLANYSLQRRGKRHDYFTSALPWPQKGDSVLLPLGGQAPIIPDSSNVGASDQMWVIDNQSGSPAAHSALVGNNIGGSTFYMTADFTGSGTGAGDQISYALNPYSTIPTSGANVGLVADLASATAATINAFRFAFDMQLLLERDARGGTRYTEILRSHFGVISPDSRLQRPEYLGGGETNINIHPVAQTAISGSTPQGNLAGFGTAVSHRGHNHGFTKSFVEHGFVIGYVSVRADLTYQQGVERFWYRQTRFDYYWPVFAALGEQSVLNQEIYAVGSSNLAQDQAVFGYQEAWAEYRYKPSRISGLFRSIATDPLDTWHLAQKFNSLPTLGTTFIQDTPPMSRVEAVADQPDFIFDSYLKLITARPMPVYSVPGLGNHF